MTEYEKAVDNIINIPRFSTDKSKLNKSGRDNLLRVMQVLNNPHLTCKAIHIAGTNGKGSTARFTANILGIKGYRVGLFTSPHLLRINERISITEIRDGNLIVNDISDEEFLKAYMAVKKAVDLVESEGGMHLSFFEFVFAMATIYFAEKSVDYVVYETGLGGRLDATNILSPEISVITSIGLDHTEYLGETIQAVASEKAGIIKQGVPVVYHTGNAEADQVILDKANLLDTPEINVAKTHYIINEISDKTIDFSMDNGYYRYRNLKLNNGIATYQVDNAMTAIVLCNELFKNEGFIEEEDLKKALGFFFWPGRMEQIHQKVIVDGAHNTDAIERFLESINKSIHRKNVHILFAVAGDKDYKPMINMLCEGLCLSKIFVTSIDSSRGVEAGRIAEVFKDYYVSHQLVPPDIYYSDNIESALKKGYYEVKNSEDILFCVGSLYLIGSIKEIAQEVLI
ncbi:MAG: bifunctional folylpolyglutamate synthase/dihydrofolate synthase [Lachnospiraceae bacterium]|nr:bifunctional folylpolyglutamate synthase/dihydrofolate synthase [Lachnospiraceae bacterium]